MTDSLLPTIPWSKLTLEERELSALIAMRAAKMVKDWKDRNKRDDLLDPDSMLIQMDVCLLHLCRPMNLRNWLAADDLSFLTDYITMTKNIRRALAYFPADVKLHFAQ